MIHEGAEKLSTVLDDVERVDDLDNHIEADAIHSPAFKIATNEWKSLIFCKSGLYQPKMKPDKVLGALSADGQPQKPVFAFGPVLERGSDLPDERGLPPKRNLADYINKNGQFDIVRFYQVHSKKFPSLSKLVIGKYSAHVSTEVDCDSLFSEAGALSNPCPSRQSK